LAASFGAGAAATVAGAVPSTRGEAMKYQPAAMTAAVTTLANIRPNALRMVYNSQNGVTAFSLSH
jgi:hypothetical protein